jgi:SAM-dependent methyltransferase
MAGAYVQYGCGWSAPEGWRNFDASPTLRFERLPLIGQLYMKNAARFPANVEFGDIVKGLPIEPASCQAVYCSHVLEHLALADFRVALRNTRRVLLPGGTFRLVLPDLEIAARKFLADSSADASLTFMRDTYLGLEQRPSGVRGLLVMLLGNSQHLWMWDYKSIARELELAGFSNVRRATFGDARDPMFGMVEEQSRWDDCLGVECTATA